MAYEPYMKELIEKVEATRPARIQEAKEGKHFPLLPAEEGFKLMNGQNLLPRYQWGNLSAGWPVVRLRGSERLPCFCHVTHRGTGCRAMGRDRGAQVINAFWPSRCDSTEAARAALLCERYSHEEQLMLRGGK